MDADLKKAIDQELRKGLPGEKTRWEQAARERAYYLNQGHKLIPARESEQALDKQTRPKIALHIVHRVINELAKGLYAHPGPSRKLARPGLRVVDGDGEASGQGQGGRSDSLLQSTSGEYRANRALQKVDAYTWLHGVCGIQVVPDVDVVRRRLTGESILRDPDSPVKFRTWNASEFAVWVDDHEPECPIAVALKSEMHGRERLQLWTDEEVKTYLARRDRAALNPNSPDIFEPVPGESGANPFGVIPILFAHQEDPTDGFWTPGIGDTLANTCYWLDQVLSDLTQSVEVFCVPEKYSRNLSVSSRLVHRPGDSIDLIERDPSKDADIFYRQPDLQVPAVWEHIENTVNEALEGLDIPIKVAVRASYEAESGVALIIRRAPLLDRWHARQLQFKSFEEDLWRLTARVAAISTDDAALLAAADTLEVEIDFPEYSFPIPSLEKDQSDSWELGIGVKSRVMVVQERQGKTRDQAIEHIKQVQADEAAVPAPPGAEAPADGEGGRDVTGLDFGGGGGGGGGGMPRAAVDSSQERDIPGVTDSQKKQVG